MSKAEITVMVVILGFTAWVAHYSFSGFASSVNKVAETRKACVKQLCHRGMDRHAECIYACSQLNRSDYEF